MIEALRDWSKRYRDRGKYTPVGVTFHWVMAAVVIYQLVSGWMMERYLAGPEKLEAYKHHSEIGLALLLLGVLRLRMQEEGAEMKRLAAQEQDLSRLIAELSSILADYPITSEEPFTALRGRLTWPVAGRLVHDFGQPRAGGQLSWNGVVLAAPRGREVRAVYHGRVVFADWLDGMGLLVIVDHGEGFMTLYGYNETTLKSAGDWVAPGDAIATVGVSGGVFGLKDGYCLMIGGGRDSAAERCDR